MSYFSVLEGETAILSNKGVFRQCDLYAVDGALFAKWGAGFVRLSGTGATSKPDIRCRVLMASVPLYRDKLGRLYTTRAEDRSPFAGIKEPLT